MRQYWVYIVASRTKVLYIGVTNNLARRVLEHKRGAVPGFTAQYPVNRLVYCEFTAYIMDARRRERQLKGWTRKRKIALIEEGNPLWIDLALGEGWLSS